MWLAMIAYPNAKINLGLNVVSKRLDGFHDIQTLFVPYFGLSDVLEVVFADEPTIYKYGLSYPGNPKDNLCFKAYQLMAAKYGIGPVGIYLYKNIPVGAGLGGGSADAAFTLKLINDLFKLNLSNEELAADAALLGSDCAFFIHNRPMLAQGRGEILSDCQLQLDDYRIELVTLPIHVSTSEAYKGIVPAQPALSISQIVSFPMEQWRYFLVNDFEKSVFAAHPEIAAAKQSLYDRGAIYASMSGSGSSVYGIFKK